MSLPFLDRRPIVVALANLKAAIGELPHVLVFDNDDLRRPFRQIAVFENGKLVRATKPIPRWLQALLRSS